ncbi:GNAT family N-acetyltransferase [uncultured Jatrophihabitans sp.]|uniref:GNAT family N-acetyltransferase n=1 Tax=uncultured Jatrophihabitans sp. TaxID=1610747 RepID=UPI0035CA17CA
MGLAHLVRSVGTRSGVFSGRPLLDSGVPRLSKRFAEIISSGERDLLVAVEDPPGEEGVSAGERIVGMLAAQCDDIGAIDLTGVLHVTHLMVDPRRRRRGVGRALLASAVELAEAADVEHVLATTASDSRESNRYLARLGFAPLVVQRIAQTSRLRRSLGMAEPMQGAAVLRRARLIRAQRAGLASYSAVRGSN